MQALAAAPMLALVGLDIQGQADLVIRDQEVQVKIALTYASKKGRLE